MFIFSVIIIISVITSACKNLKLLIMARAALVNKSFYQRN